MCAVIKDVEGAEKWWSKLYFEINRRPYVESNLSAEVRNLQGV